MLKDKLKNARLALGISQEKLGRIMGVTQQTIAKWENGLREPDLDTLKKLSLALNIDMVELITGIEENAIPIKNIDTDVAYFPIIGRVRAGYGGEAVEEYTGENMPIPTSSLKGQSPDNFFCLRVSGDSMFPRLLDGDKVLVERCESVDSGTIAIVLYNGCDATIKKVVYHMGEDWIDLVPLNTYYPPRRIQGIELQDCRILGKVVSLIRNF